MNRFLLIFLLFCTAFGQNHKILSKFSLNNNLSDELSKIVRDLDLDKDFDVGEDGIEQISLAVIDLSKSNAELGGVNMENFIYPASVYKMYVAASILELISKGEFSLSDNVIVKFPNAVDKSREIRFDPRPLLSEGDTVTINYLLDLMITRSDNTAANCLIDIASREKINKFIKDNFWDGSEVTRKFVKRKFEDSSYQKVRGTETCALHAADFMYKIQTNTLVDPWVSMQMKTLLSRQLDKSKLAQGFPKNTMFSHKTGWFSYWTNDVGIADDGSTRFIVACFMPLREESAFPKMKLIAGKIFNLLKK